MRKYGNAIAAAIALIILLFGCTHREKAPDAVPSSISSETELESAQKCAVMAADENDLTDGDIIVVYDTDMLSACCFKYDKGAVTLMYDGDYKGSYELLTCVFQNDYDDWSVLIYRQKKSDAIASASVDITELAENIFSEYTEKYGDLRVGSIIYILEQSGEDHQFATLTKGSLEYIDRNDVRYDVWQSSDQADDYWAKLIHDDPDGISWVVYEYDTFCTKAFNAIADMADAISEVDEVAGGTVFIYEKDGRQAAMQFFDGAVYYIQKNDLDEVLSGMEEYSTSGIENAAENVRVYIPAIKEG